MSRSPRRRGESVVRLRIAGRDDGGLTLVEMLVALTIMTAIMSAFFLVYFAFAQSATNTVGYSQNEGTVRNVVRALESDLRSADPATVVPSSFTLDANGAATSGNIVAMYLSYDRFSPCSTKSSTTNPVPLPFESNAFAANVIWAYDPGPGTNKGTLIRYSYCTSTSTWTAGMKLLNVSNTSGSVFALTAATGTQVTTPSSTTVVNQAAPLCDLAVNVGLKISVKGQQVDFRTRVMVPFTNQGAVIPQACQ